MGDETFAEHEHKFLVGPDFDVEAFCRRVEALGPTARDVLTVRDTYLEVDAVPTHIFRHRLDVKLQQLTVKSRGGDNESRLEVNLDLAGGDQLRRVTAFLGAFGAVTPYELVKDLRVYYFPTCEIVYYAASHRQRACRCVELEAIAAPSRGAALAVIADYERRLGLDGSERCRKSLFELLVKEGSR